jgi:hypothetical protein
MTVYVNMSNLMFLQVDKKQPESVGGLNYLAAGIWNT